MKAKMKALIAVLIIGLGIMLAMGLVACDGGGGDKNSSFVNSDTSAPTVPTNLTVTAFSSSQIDLSWTASTDNTDVSGYTIYIETEM